MSALQSHAPQKLSRSQFNDFRHIVHRTCGIQLSDDKRELLNARLGKRLRALRVQADQYLAIIDSDPAEMDRFVDAISTNHTFFFRESRVFDVIDAGCRDIWCAASSSGEEPYSLAAYCLDRGISVNILATDISDSCLHKGRSGVYSLESSRHIPRPILKKYFQKGSRHRTGLMRVKPELRRSVRFDRFNLLTDPPPDRKFDIIFCRNVMIYFDNPTREKVVEKLCRTLNKGGHFVIGGSESLNNVSHRLKYVAPSVYCKHHH